MRADLTGAISDIMAAAIAAAIISERNTMNPEELLRQRRADWAELEALLKRATQNIRLLTPAEVTRLGNLYRLASSDLALAQRDFPTHRLTPYLNQLVAQAHAALYRTPPVVGAQLREFILRGYPRLFRASLPYVLAAFLLFTVPGIIVGTLTYLNPEAARWTLPAEVQSLIPIVENESLWIDLPPAERPFSSGFIAANNIQVSFLAFAGGMLAGLLTVYAMVFNGLILGGLLGLTAHYGVGDDLANFIIAHGVIELSVIFIAGGAGLMVGHAMLRPGLLRRRDAVSAAAQQAVRLVSAAIPLLLVAGAIEGFISPAASIPPLVKWGVGSGSGLLLYGYLLFGGRGDERSG